MNFKLPGNDASCDATQTKGAVEPANNFLFLFSLLIYRRQLPRCGYLKAAQQVCLTCLSMHQRFSLTFTENRCLCLLRLRVRVCGRSYIIISQFTFSFSLCLRNHHTTSCKPKATNSHFILFFLFLSKTNGCSQQTLKNNLPFVVETLKVKLMIYKRFL